MTEQPIRFLRLQGIARDWSKHNEHSRNIFSVHGFLRLSVKCRRKRQQGFAGTLILKIAEGVNTLLPICMGDRGSYVICSCRERKSPGGVISGKIPGIQPGLVLSLLSCRNNRYT